uniref:Ig-like domain-containing protein n=1 Tax=Timema poppense TaxID=170557 RepID=A0A7R9DCU2_TIMPO|nr:unnamed protein product [Timema poppensis]
MYSENGQPCAQGAGRIGGKQEGMGLGLCRSSIELETFRIDLAVDAATNTHRTALPDLNKHFEAPPYSQAVEVGGSVELRCHPPLGVPPPTVYWLKNSAPLETDTNLIVSSEGHLLVGQARLEDTANYTCVAENVAAHRLSEAARLVVYVNGGWSAWSAWSECSPSCGHGMKKRSRLCVNPAPLDGGLTCQGPSVQRSDCTSECPGKLHAKSSLKQLPYMGNP